MSAMRVKCHLVYCSKLIVRLVRVTTPLLPQR